MMPRACAIVVLALAAEARSVEDGTALVQHSLKRSIDVDPDPTVNLTANLSNNSNNSSAIIFEHPRLYRINFTKTWGDDHFCLTEIEFYDIEGNTLNATYVSASSCYGCAIDCDGCKVPYGNQHMLFDKSWSTEGPDAWACSDVGTFKAATDAEGGASGSSALTFQVEARRPASYSVRRANTDGSAITKDWSMHEQQKDGSWSLISTVVDAPKAMNQTYDVVPDMGPAGRWWEWADPACLSDYDGSGLVTRVQLDCNYEDGRTPLVASNGYGIHFDDNFGFLNLDGATYVAKQVNIVHSNKRTVGRDQVVTAPLEMRIVHQKVDSPDYDDIVVVAVPLRLPLESESQTTESEAMFVNLGLTTLPTEGAPRNLAQSFNLSAFKQQLDGGAEQLPCAVRLGMEDPKAQKWFITNPALVTGAVATAFKQMFPIAALTAEEEAAVAAPAFGTMANMGYNQLGRQSYGGQAIDLSAGVLAQPGVDAQGMLNEPQVASGAKWVHNPAYQPQAGEWASAGEWSL